MFPARSIPSGFPAVEDASILSPVISIGSQLDALPALQQMAVPDLWQQQAVAALRAGQDVVVQAPTGAGKTLVFELWSNQGKNRGQAIYTVPTRALANDKLAEWRARGWNVGIATGDLAENLDAPVLVATLETQKNRLICGDGPSLLVVDEYQMISDQDRGLNYELAIAMAPEHTQLLLLSGSVANPQDVVHWLQRLGRSAVLIRHDIRPVPLEEVHASTLNYHLPSEIRGYWPRLVAKALAEDLGPVLIFAPRRHAAEVMAGELSRQLPNPNPLQLTPEQRAIAGESLTRLLKARVAYHHSGLSYGARAGVIEPLAKAGQLRVVVATMGLAAGINFSLRSVALAGESYRREEAEQLLRADELMQMFGRAGRRGLDETGFVLITANELRLLDGHPCHLTRSRAVDWAALLGIMRVAAESGKDPFREAVQAQDRLFTTKPIVLGIEESLKHPDTPCNLRTDSERARHVRKRYLEMLNSRGEWEPLCEQHPRPLGEILTPATQQTPDTRALDAPPPSLVAALGSASAVEKVGQGVLCVLSQENGITIHGRASTVADRLEGGKVLLAKWVRRLTNWSGRQVPDQVWLESLRPLVIEKLAQNKTPVVRFAEEGQRILAITSIADLTLRVPVDRHGVAIWKPIQRDVIPSDCARCERIAVCAALPTSTGVALLWRRLGLIDVTGVPTRRGTLVSFFSQGDGLALAAALEDDSYQLEELVYDIANLDGGFRFCGDENRWGGRLAETCHRSYGLQSVPGYLENGVPPKYGAGAEVIVAAVHKDPAAKHAWISERLGPGDIDRAIIEWRSLLRQIAHAPQLLWERWQRLQQLAKSMLNETESPTLTTLPPLDYTQTRRVDHRLILRRH